jgi:hypothetical protein
MLKQVVEADVVVVGGGLSGVCAAVAAARRGVDVVLINNRPVLGGNSSSEVRVWVCGATAHGNQRWARETGIIGEMYVENQFRNPEGNPVYWDDVVLDTVRREKNIRLFLNTDVRDVVASGPEDARRVETVTGWTMGSEILTTFRAPVFLDCTGDGLVGHLAGARYRLGKEARSEFDEEWAPDEPVEEFLGSTLLFYTKDLGFPVKYVAPESAKDIRDTPIPTSRVIRSGDSGAHYWWVEWGGELDTVHDNETIRDELRSVILGIWDYIKNSGEFDADTLTLEWVGNVPGKREYRRFVGDYTLTQNDIVEQTSFPDTVAFGGWSIDLHPAAGMYHEGSGAVQRFSDGVFEIPYRCLYPASTSNLLVAGRNISATHIAFGASRVMATCAALGQAAGTAAALCVEHAVTPRELGTHHLAELRRALLRDDAPIIGAVNDDPDDHARTARVTASSTLSSIGTGPGRSFGGGERRDGGTAPGAAQVPAPRTDLVAENRATPHPLVDDLGIVLPVHPRLDSIDLLVSRAVLEPVGGEDAVGGTHAVAGAAPVDGAVTRDDAASPDSAASRDTAASPDSATSADRTPPSPLVVEVWSTGKPQNVVPSRLEVTTSVEVPAGEARWVRAQLDYQPGSPETAIVVLRADPSITVHLTDPLPPGVLTLVHGAASDDQNVEVSQSELLVQWPTRPLRGRSVCFVAHPESEALAPERATSGGNRPYGGPSMWASAPMSPGTPEWLRLDWDEPVEVSELVLVLDDDVDLELNTLHHHRSPHETIPELVRDYRVEVLTADAPDGRAGDQDEAQAPAVAPSGAPATEPSADLADETWTVIADETDNRWRRRVHRLPTPTRLRAARVVVTATNGTPQARVVALRAQA